MDNKTINQLIKNILKKDYSFDDAIVISEYLQTLFQIKELMKNIGKTQCPLKGGKRRIWLVLSDLAAQENCDGEPYDQMQDASDYIRKLEQILKIEYV